MKILVVDDQPDVVAGILDGVNWRALHVEKAYSALTALSAPQKPRIFSCGRKSTSFCAISRCLEKAV